MEEKCSKMGKASAKTLMWKEFGIQHGGKRELAGMKQEKRSQDSSCEASQVTDRIVYSFWEMWEPFPVQRMICWRH